MKKRKTANRVSDFLEIPRDVLVTLPRVTVVGDGEIKIDGFLGISEYETNRVGIRTKTGVVLLLGDSFEIVAISEEGILIRGEIKTVEFI